MKVGEIFEGQKKFDVVVWGVPRLRSDLGAIRALEIDTPLGVQVRLGDVADVEIVAAPNEVRRENASRRLDVTCNVSGRDLGAVARDVEEKVKAIPFDREYHPEFLGEYAARQESTRKLYALAGLALVGIVLLLYVDFGAWRPTWLVALTIPFALVGGVFAGLLHHRRRLARLARRLRHRARHRRPQRHHARQPLPPSRSGRGHGLRDPAGAPRRRGAARANSDDSVRNGTCILPLAITGNKPGQEIEYPLAVVILGGLVTSTLLNLFLLPPLYARFGRPVGMETAEI